jgi:hypothetical protein
MRRTVVLAAILAAAWAAVAAADGGGPSPGVDQGDYGILSPDGKLRYLAIPAWNRTFAEAVTTRGAHVVRMTFLRGAFGIPFVAVDGTTGGLARSGNRLVLGQAPYGRQPPDYSRFVVLDRRNFHVQARLRLKGSWAFDAISPRGSLMYLIQLLGAPNSGRYAVRALNLNTGRLYPGAIIDRRKPDEKMTGQPATRVESRDGWAYTLYGRAGKGPFVHALDTVHRKAFCVDLPWRATKAWLWRVRLQLRGGDLLLRRGAKVIARVDTKTLEVST